MAGLAAGLVGGLGRGLGDRLVLGLARGLGGALGTAFSTGALATGAGFAGAVGLSAAFGVPCRCPWPCPAACWQPVSAAGSAASLPWGSLPWPLASLAWPWPPWPLPLRLAGRGGRHAVPLGRQRQPRDVATVVDQDAPRVLEGDLHLAVGDHLGHEPDPELGVVHHDVLAVRLAELVGFGVLGLLPGEEVLPARLLQQRPLLGSHWLGNVVLGLAPRLAEGVHIPAGVALNTPDLVLVLRDDDMRRIRLALGAVGLDIRTDLVDVVFEHEVHTCPRYPRTFAQ